jgi:papain fold toxin 1 (glutamine deamidase) of polymorphic toxin system
MGARFGPIAEAAGINHTIFRAGEGARGIVFAHAPPGKPLGHFFNIVRHGGNVMLLDGQPRTPASWAEIRQNGFTQFQLLRTN